MTQPDKEFRYLRTVIVTAAVHQGLSRERKPPSVTFWHWAGISPYTSAYARSQGPVFLINSRLASFAAAHVFRRGQPLFRSYGCFIAEFLDASYPEHLSLLDYPTGVGLRYGLMRLSVARVFLETEGDGLIPPKEGYLGSELNSPCGFAYRDQRFALSTCSQCTRSDPPIPSPRA